VRVGRRGLIGASVVGAYSIAAHGFEVPFVTNNVSGSKEITYDLPEAHALANKMTDSWIAFARTGDPNVPSLPAWPQYTAKAPQVMLFNYDSGAGPPMPAEIQALWRERPALSYR
jgi:carboxylesterase type B